MGGNESTCTYNSPLNNDCVTIASCDLVHVHVQQDTLGTCTAGHSGDMYSRTLWGHVQQDTGDMYSRTLWGHVQQDTLGTMWDTTLFIGHSRTVRKDSGREWAEPHMHQISGCSQYNRYMYTHVHVSSQNVSLYSYLPGDV